MFFVYLRVALVDLQSHEINNIYKKMSNNEIVPGAEYDILKMNQHGYAGAEPTSGQEKSR